MLGSLGPVLPARGGPSWGCWGCEVEVVRGVMAVDQGGPMEKKGDPGVTHAGRCWGPPMGGPRVEAPKPLGSRSAPRGDRRPIIPPVKMADLSSRCLCCHPQPLISLQISLILISCTKVQALKG